MRLLRACGALARAMASITSQQSRYQCESLERRRLLTASNDPVIVLMEPFSLSIFPEHNSEIAAHLWNNPQEVPYDLQAAVNGQPWLDPANDMDGDGNGYRDDVYGWNFTDGPNGSPNIVKDTDGHGKSVLGAVLDAITTAGAAGTRVKIMYVIGPMSAGSASLQYVLDEKAAGVNIIAVGATLVRPDASAAAVLGEHGILQFSGITNADINLDSDVGGGNDAVLNATPRKGLQAPPLANVIPVTTDPRLHLEAYGINSFYFAAHSEAQSYAAPKAAAMAAVAVQVTVVTPFSSSERLVLRTRAIQPTRSDRAIVQAPRWIAFVNRRVARKNKGTQLRRSALFRQRPPGFNRNRHANAGAGRT